MSFQIENKGVFSVLAYSNLLTLYLLIAGLTLIILWGLMASVKEFH